MVIKGIELNEVLIYYIECHIVPAFIEEVT
jgi:hypothetical protein